MRTVPQIGVITSNPVRKYRFSEALSDFTGLFMERFNDTSFTLMPQAISCHFQ